MEWWWLECPTTDQIQMAFGYLFPPCMSGTYIHHSTSLRVEPLRKKHEYIYACTLDTVLVRTGCDFWLGTALLVPGASWPLAKAARTKTTQSTSINTAQSLYTTLFSDHILGADVSTPGSNPVETLPHLVPQSSVYQTSLHHDTFINPGREKLLQELRRAGKEFSLGRILG